MYSTDDITSHIDEKGIAVITIARKPGNAFNKQLYMDLGTIVDTVARDERTRVIILRSGLKYFTVGLDLGDLGSIMGAAEEQEDPARKALVLRTVVKEWQDKFSAVERSLKPVIGVAHGFCIGAGVDLLAACDINIADEGTLFSIREVKVGLAADVGSLNKLTKKFGASSKIYELALTGRDFSAAEARELNFVSHVTKGGSQKAFESAYAIATEIAENSPIAVMGTKHLVNYSKDHSVQDSLDYTAAWNSAMLQTSDLMNAGMAVMNKTKASFDPIPKL